MKKYCANCHEQMDETEYCQLREELELSGENCMTCEILEGNITPPKPIPIENHS